MTGPFLGAVAFVASPWIAFLIVAWREHRPVDEIEVLSKRDARRDAVKARQQ